MTNRTFSSVYTTLQILRYAFEANRAYTALFLLIPMLIGLLPFLSAYVLKLVIDLFAGKFDPAAHGPEVLPLALLFILIDFVRSFLAQAVEFVEFRLKDELGKSVATRMFSKIDRMQYALFERNETYDTIQRCTASIDWRPLHIMQRIPETLTTSIAIVVALAVTSSIGWWVAPLIVASTVPQLLLANKIADLQVSISDVRSPVSRKYGYFQQLLTGNDAVKEIRLFNAFPRLLAIVRGLFDIFSADRITMGRKKFAYNLGTELLQLGTVGAVVICLFVDTMHGAITIGSLTFFVDVVHRLRGSSSQLFFAIADIRGHALFLQPFFELLKFEEERQGGEPLPSGAFESIEFKNVCFHYSDGTRSEQVLSGINLKIARGDHLAIVGLNGAGKTTLIKLLLRFYAPHSGELLIDGRNADAIDKKAWFKQFCVLFQDFVRYSLTARENIEFGDPEKNDPTAYESAKAKADADAVIARLQKRDEQMLTHQYEDGTDLSGGEWQRIALARAYFRDAPILILDEPTAAIDALSEVKIFDSVQQLARDRTVIMISHRFSTVRKAKRIVVLDCGRISEDGTHQELMALGGTYAKMFQAQAVGYQ